MIKCKICGEVYEDYDIGIYIHYVDDTRYPQCYICEDCLEEINYERCDFCAKLSSVDYMIPLWHDGIEYIVHTYEYDVLKEALDNALHDKEDN